MRLRWKMRPGCGSECQNDEDTRNKHETDDDDDDDDNDDDF